MIFKIYALCLTMVFLLFAQLQLNDPDAVPWFCFYLWVALQPLAYLLDTRFRWTLGLSMACSLLAMFFYAPSLLQLLTNTDGIGLEQSMSHAYPYIEEARECAGLLIVLLSNGGLFIWGQKRQQKQLSKTSQEPKSA